MTSQTSFRKENEDFGEQIMTKAVKAGRRTFFLMCVPHAVTIIS